LKDYLVFFGSVDSTYIFKLKEVPPESWFLDNFPDLPELLDKSVVVDQFESAAVRMEVDNDIYGALITRLQLVAYLAAVSVLQGAMARYQQLYKSARGAVELRRLTEARDTITYTPSGPIVLFS
jgi:hypothetical protein